MVGLRLHRLEERRQGSTALSRSPPAARPGGARLLRPTRRRRARTPGRARAAPRHLRRSATSTTGSREGAFCTSRWTRCSTTGRPDFPFCLCWANENWTRVWDGLSDAVLVEQRYSEEDDRAHMRWLADVFRDERYVRVDGKPLFLVYRAEQLARTLPRRPRSGAKRHAASVSARSSWRASRASTRSVTIRARSGSTPPSSSNPT